MNNKLLRGIFLSFVLLSILFVFVANSGGELKGDKNVIYVLRIEGTITEGTSLEVVEGLREAGEIDAEAVLVELNTPGGLVDSTLKITEAILNSE
ncbi:MAG: hypothetical protein KAT65_23160, partial [Methanophagales archaeon]|nr:hypothetical protein [Methanophagales archaeon]